MPAQKIAVIGHSFTMDLHWSSPSAFVPIVTAMFAAENPKVEFRQFQGGGLTSSRAYKNFFADAVAWKPDTRPARGHQPHRRGPGRLRKMGEGLRRPGLACSCSTTSTTRTRPIPPSAVKEAAVAKDAGITVVEVSRVLAASPDRPRFFCLDHIHMTEPYHRLMAKEWLKVLVGARGAALGD